MRHEGFKVRVEYKVFKGMGGGNVELIYRYNLRIIPIEGMAEP